MAEALAKHRLTWDEYLELERTTDTRHEYLDGEAWAMAGGTPRHSAVIVNTIGELHAVLRGRPCRVYESNTKVYVEDTDLASYPDVAVVCGPPVRAAHDKNVVTNPTVLVEVLSPSTAAWDRGGKFAHYQHVPTLKHYVLVDPEQVRVELFTRQEDGSWRYTLHGAGAEVRLDAVDVTLAVDSLYVDLPE